MSVPDRAALERTQLAQLRHLLGLLTESNRFYGLRLAAAGLGGGLESLAAFRESLPPTTKAELVADQQQHPPYGTNLTFPIERYTRFCQTSGTSGQTLRWLDTTASWEWMVENWVEVFRASGVVAGDRIFFAFSFGPFLGFWTAFAAGERLSCLCLPGGGMSSAARLRVIEENAVTTLCCTPTYAIRLGEVAQEEGIRLSGTVRKIVVAGEPGAGIPATRARIEALWPGAALYDHHGMTEVGPVSIPCPARPGVLHILEERFLPEVVDPATLQPVGPGEKGELLLTNLGRLGSPLLRYRTGDLVLPAASQPCACGRYDMALEGGILGRTDDMVVVRGVNLYPSAVEAVLRPFPALAEYRVVLCTQQALAECRVEIEPSAECTDPDALAAQIATALRATFHLRLPVTAVAPGTLPRFELKARRWVRES